MLHNSSFQSKDRTTPGNHPETTFFEKCRRFSWKLHNVMEKHIRKNGEGECWWSRIASPYPDANNVAPPAANDDHFLIKYTNNVSKCLDRVLFSSS